VAPLERPEKVSREKRGTQVLCSKLVHRWKEGKQRLMKLALTTAQIDHLIRALEWRISTTDDEELLIRLKRLMASLKDQIATYEKTYKHGGN